MILSIDPGRRPGYVLLDETQLVERRHFPDRPSLPLVVAVATSLAEFPGGNRPVPPISRVVIEGQHGVLTRARTRSILTLSVEAGWQLNRAVSVHGGVPVVIHPQALAATDPPGWRDALRVARVTKEVVQARVEKSLAPAEASLFACASAARRGDCLDAVAIGWGAWIAQTPEWSPPP